MFMSSAPAARGPGGQEGGGTAVQGTDNAVFADAVSGSLIPRCGGCWEAPFTSSYPGVGRREGGQKQDGPVHFRICCAVARCLSRAVRLNAIRDRPGAGQQADCDALAGPA